ncbi:MAG: AAA family ATPase [Paenibacillus sp.]|uniref:ATP-dependent nuclease n=1 Tax=Paenibacillus sp. TaxID=58172 RepID=UPI00290E7F91|nr:AAA family ATPase [Paenibacillus sp.]MDU4696357.1 AAA family ATPase [Paenibacillus sp.]
MFLSELRIWNFRKYGSGEFEEGTGKSKPGLFVKFNPGLNIIVGENDSGKTAIIDALKLVLTTQSNDYIRLEYEDFHMPHGTTLEEERTDSLEIQCIFRDLKSHEAKNFLEWLSFETVGTEKTFCLKVILKGRRKGRRVYYDVKAGSDEEGSLMNSEARALLRATYLKPLRDAEHELAPRKNSRLSQILDSHQAFEDKENHHLKRVMEQANKLILHYFQGHDGAQTFDDQNGKLLLDKINTYLKEFSPSTLPLNSIFSISDMKLRTILEKLSLELSMNKSGLGSHNLLFIAVELLLLNREEYTGLKIALVEEIEAHIHPQAQLRLIEYLQKESTDLGVQLILTTHSTVLASKVSLKNLILCNNGNCFSMDSESTKLEVGDYSFLERFLDSTKANFFFAKGVILVEGDAEHLLLPTIAEIIERPLSKYGTTLVNVGSTAFLRYSRIFQRQDETKGKMNIPVAIITDNDVKPNFSSDGKNIIDPSEIEISQQKKAELYNGQTVKTFVSPFWTLEYDLAAGGNLTKEFYQAVLYAKKIQNSDKYGLTAEKKTARDQEVETNLATWQQEGLSQEKIAFEIYKGIMLKENDKVSKAIVAQCLAGILSETKDRVKLKDKILTDKNLNYIVQAINYATTGFEGDI